MPAEILLVEDTPSLSQLYVNYLKTSGCKIIAVDTGNDALAKLEASIPAVALLDLQLPDMNGMDILRSIRQRGLPTEVIVITANGSINTAVEAMREGAADFLVKPFPAERLRVTVQNVLERTKLRAAVDTLQDSGHGRYGDFIGGSLAMQAVYRIIDSAAASKASVFITGESGTGKELCAEALHRRSPRRAGPFVALNCAALPRELIESEIFGHVKGAFTGATADREGAAKRAHNGTLFLDEICEMDLGLQSKLLRFLQTGAVQRVGSDRTDTADIRVVCATNRDPAAEVKAGRFREDLFYRLQVIPIELPPLREREDDVLLLARHFLERFGREEKHEFSGFSPDAEAVLRRYDWPGNVRELQNVIRNVAVLNPGGTVTATMLPTNLIKAAPPITTSPAVVSSPRNGGDQSQVRPLWRVERDAIESAIKACDGNVPRAAALLEVSPSTIYRKLQAWSSSDQAIPGRAAS
jgi:DNA-binding NtrC family response regulator